jgi:YegS/Rv2252/BmrU family lipid kinase
MNRKSGNVPDAPVSSLPEGRAAARLVVAFHNPGTGRLATADLWRLLERELGPDFRVRVHETRPDGDTAALVRAVADEAAVVLASGGDGTVNGVAAGLIGHATPLAILPTGTTNIIAQGLGIPANFPAACRLVREDPVAVALDVAAVGERYLIHMGGAGYDAQLMAVTSRALKRGLGLAAYLVYGARGLLDQPSVDFTVLVDGRTIHERGWMALVANGGDIVVRGVRIGPDISSTDGLLDLVLFTAPKPRDAVASFLSILTRRYRSPYLRYERGRQIEIHADPPLPVEFDGDPAGTTPFIAEILPGALTVLVPSPDSGGPLGPWLRRNWQELIPRLPAGFSPPDGPWNRPPE